MARPIFLTGLARSGTNLLARMLIAGDGCRIAIHAFQPWFKSLRNAIIARDGTPEMLTRFNPNSPFGDGYFDHREFAMQSVVHNASLDVPIVSTQLPVLLERVAARASDEAADLCLGLATLKGADYHEMMDRILALVGCGYESRADLVGLIDTWIIDLLPALARTYPDAKFLVVIRDPRAVVASVLKFMDSAPHTVGHVLSIIRQWRKYVALSYEFRRQGLFSGRLELVRYEDQVRDPEEFARRLCGFLDLSFRSEMIDFSLYQDPATGSQWTGNSAFDANLQRIDLAAVGRWRRTLSPTALSAIEFCCGSDMEACGYVPVNPFDRLIDDPHPLAFLIADGQRNCAWRTDSGDAAAEYERERCRRNMIVASDEPAADDVRRAFLSFEYFKQIQNRSRLFPDA